MRDDISSSEAQAFQAAGGYRPHFRMTVYRNRNYFAIADMTNSGSTLGQDNSGVHYSDLIPSDLTVDTSGNIISAYNDAGTIKLSVNGGTPFSISGITTATGSRIAIDQYQLAYTDTTMGVHLVALNSSAVLAGSSACVSTNTNVYTLHWAGAVELAGQDSIVALDLVKGAIQVVYIHIVGGTPQVSIDPDRRFFFPTEVLIDTNETRSRLNFFAAATLGNSIFVYLSLPSGEVKRWALDTSTGVWGEIETAIPADLTAFYISNTYLDTENHIHLVGQFVRTQEQYNGSISCLDLWSADGRVFSMDRFTLFSDSGYRLQGTVAGTQIAYGYIDRWIKVPGTFTTHGLSADRLAIPPERIAQQSGSPDGEFSVSIAVGDESYQTNGLITLGAKTILEIGIDQAGVTNWHDFQHGIISGMDRDVFGRKLSLTITHEGNWRTATITFPMYLEMESKQAFRDETEGLSGLASLSTTNGVPDTLSVDFWNRLNNFVSGGLEVQTHSATPVDVMSGNIVSAAGLADTPRIPGFPLTFKIYGWSRAGVPDTNPNTADPTPGLATATNDTFQPILKIKHNGSDATVVISLTDTAQAHPPQGYVQTAPGDMPVVYTVGSTEGLAVDDEITEIGVRVTSPNGTNTTFYVERIECPDITMYVGASGDVPISWKQIDVTPTTTGTGSGPVYPTTPPTSTPTGASVNYLLTVQPGEGASGTSYPDPYKPYRVVIDMNTINTVRDYSGCFWTSFYGLHINALPSGLAWGDVGMLSVRYRLTVIQTTAATWLTQVGDTIQFFTYLNNGSKVYDVTQNATPLIYIYNNDRTTSEGSSSRIMHNNTIYLQSDYYATHLPANTVGASVSNTADAFGKTVVAGLQDLNVPENWTYPTQADNEYLTLVQDGNFIPGLFYPSGTSLNDEIFQFEIEEIGWYSMSDAVTAGGTTRGPYYKLWDQAMEDANVAAQIAASSLPSRLLMPSGHGGWDVGVTYPNPNQLYEVDVDFDVIRTTYGSGTYNTGWANYAQFFTLHVNELPAGLSWHDFGMLSIKYQVQLRRSSAIVGSDNRRYVFLETPDQYVFGTTNRHTNENGRPLVIVSHNDHGTNGAPNPPYNYVVIVHNDQILNQNDYTTGSESMPDTVYSFFNNTWDAQCKDYFDSATMSGDALDPRNWIYPPASVATAEASYYTHLLQDGNFIVHINPGYYDAQCKYRFTITEVGWYSMNDVATGSQTVNGAGSTRGIYHKLWDPTMENTFVAATTPPTWPDTVSTTTPGDSSGINYVPKVYDLEFVAKGIPSLMFANTPYSAWNFDQWISYDVVGNYAWAGMLGHAKDANNLTGVRLRSNRMQVFVRRGGREIVLADWTGTYPASGKVKWSHRDGVFKIYLWDNALHGWAASPIHTFTWDTTFSGPIVTSTDIMHLGVFSWIDVPRFRICSYSLDTCDGIPMLGGQLLSRLDMFPPSGIVEIGTTQYNYTSILAHAQDIRGPFAVRNINNWGGSPACEFTYFDWNAASNAQAGRLMASNGAYTWTISSTDWRVAISTGGATVWLRNRSRHFGNVDLKQVVSASDKMWVTTGLGGITAASADSPIHAEGQYCYLHSDDKVTLHGYFGTSGQSDMTISDMLTYIAAISGTDVRFPGDKTYTGLSITATQQEV